MSFIGIELENIDLERHILRESSTFLDWLDLKMAKSKNWNFGHESVEVIPEMEYYLVYNRFVRIGKRDIDKRVVRKVSYDEILAELKENWFPGLEPNFVLIPTFSDSNLRIYIQQYIFKLDEKIELIK